MKHSTFLDAVMAYSRKNGLRSEYTDNKTGRLLEVSYKTKRVFFGAPPLSPWPVNSEISSTVAKNKDLTLRLCSNNELFIPITKAGVVSTDQWSYLDEEPLLIKDIAVNFGINETVIKPNDSFSANGLIFLYGKKYIDDAITIAAKYGNEVIIQEQLFGDDYRYYAFDGTPIAKIKRRYLNLDLNTPEYNISKKSYIEENRKNITDNPYRVSNYSIVKEFPYIDPNISNEEKDMLLKIAKIFKLTFFAVDCIKDENKIFILEVNSNPGVQVFYRQKEDSIAYSIFERIIKLCLEKASG